MYHAEGGRGADAITNYRNQNALLEKTSADREERDNDPEEYAYRHEKAGDHDDDSSD